MWEDCADLQRSLLSFTHRPGLVHVGSGTTGKTVVYRTPRELGLDGIPSTYDFEIRRGEKVL